MPLSRQEEFFVSEYQEEEMSVATTDMTGSVAPGEAAEDGVRDKDGFLVPQRPRDDGSDTSVSVNDVSDVTGDSDIYDDDSIATENTRDS